MGNGESKELICMTYGHELRLGNDGGRGVGTGQRGIKERKIWDNCNSIIDKIYYMRYTFKAKINIISKDILKNETQIPKKVLQAEGNNPIWKKE